MSVQRATVLVKSAWLSTEFGQACACRRYCMTPDRLAEFVGRYARGKRKGLLRGALIWRHCTVGGWWRSPTGGGCVVRPGARFDRYIDLNGKELRLVEPTEASAAVFRAQHPEFFDRASS